MPPEEVGVGVVRVGGHRLVQAPEGGSRQLGGHAAGIADVTRGRLGRLGVAGLGAGGQEHQPAGVGPGLGVLRVQVGGGVELGHGVGRLARLEQVAGVGQVGAGAVGMAAYLLFEGLAPVGLGVAGDARPREALAQGAGQEHGGGAGEGADPEADQQPAPPGHRPGGGRASKPSSMDRSTAAARAV
jgi:hypothetical protein